jgi:hypothetical protein
LGCWGWGWGRLGFVVLLQAAGGPGDLQGTRQAQMLHQYDCMCLEQPGRTAQTVVFRLHLAMHAMLSKQNTMEVEGSSCQQLKTFLILVMVGNVTLVVSERVYV